MRKYNINDLVQEVRDLGYDVNGHMDLMKIGPKDKNVIPIMLSYLGKTDYQNQKEFIVRCLTVKGFKEVTRIFLEEFKRESEVYYDSFNRIRSPESLRWAIGNAFFHIEDKSILIELRQIAMNKKYGTSRTKIVEALGKMKDTNSISILIDLLNDPDVQAHAIKAISYFKNDSLDEYIEPFLNHENPLVRKEAVKAINKWKRLRENANSKMSSEGDKKLKEVENNLNNINIEELEEASTNFDMENIEPFLKTLIPLIDSGFGISEINGIMDVVNSMTVEQELEVGRFLIKYKGKDTLLIIQVFLDDIDSPDVYIFTEPTLAEEINDLMQSE